MSFQNRLRNFLKSTGLTQTEIAKRMGYTRGNFSHYLGDREPNMLFFLKLSEVFPEVDLNYLIKGDKVVYLGVAETPEVYISKKNEIRKNGEGEVHEDDTIRMIDEISQRLEELKKNVTKTTRHNTK